MWMLQAVSRPIVELTRSRVRWGFSRLILFSAFLLGISFTFSDFVLGQAEEPPERVEEVRIVGNRRIPESTILYYIQSKENDRYNEEQVLRDYKNLLNTNFFVDASVKKIKGETGTVILFEVKERPLVRVIEYRNMKSFKESDVLEKFREMKVGMTVDSPLDEAKLPKARRAIKALLDGNGRPLGRVEISIEPITSSASKLIFEIDEGPKVRVGKIMFEGNTVISDGELRAALELTKERGPITLFKGLDKYIKEKVEYDSQVNMLDKYKERGYILAKAGEPKVEIVEAPRGMLIGFRKTKQQYYITISIEEGSQFRYGTFELNGVKNFKEAVLKRAYNIREGEIVNYTSLKKANEELKKLYSRFGYLDMEPVPEMKLDHDKKVVNVKIQVEEGKQYLVHRINFVGNTKTRDKVLRREFLMEEQRMFNGDMLDISVLRINQLGFFEKIEEEDYEVIKRPEDAEVDVVLNVKERSQQSIGLTGGVSGISGSFFGINYSTNNFRGLGQQIDVQLLTGTRTAQYQLSFREPYFLDSRVSLGYSIFKRRFRYDTFTAFFGMINPEDNLTLFTRNTTGFSVHGGYALWRWTRLGLRYSLQSTRISDVEDSFSDFAFNQLVGFTPGGDVKGAADGILRSEVSPSLVYNSKDALFGATRGSQLNVQLPIAGGPLGGSYNVLSPYVDYQKFIRDRFLSGGRHTLAFRAQFQHLIPFGTLPNGGPMTVPFFERIFRGGEFDFRGFNLRSVTPWAISRQPAEDSLDNPIVDPFTGLPTISENLVPTGGDTSLILTAEYRMPILGPLTLNAFVDFGTVTVLKKENLNFFGPDQLIELQEQTNNIWRASTGAELQFLLPVVNQPFRLIFAYNPLVMNTTAELRGIRFPLTESRKNVKFTVGYTF